MWMRRTFHECASELEGISQSFRAAHMNRCNGPEGSRLEVLRDTSTRGVEVLRILALSIRNDQDYGLTNISNASIGALREDMSLDEARIFVREYRPPYRELSGFKSLKLRQALNKIAHANPDGSGFYADMDIHDLILTGCEREKTWAAVISVVDLCALVQSLPDACLQA